MKSFVSELKELDSKATKGPWTDDGLRICGNGRSIDVAGSTLAEINMPGGRFSRDLAHGEPQGNAALIVHLRNSVPAILEMAERLERAEDVLRAIRNNTGDNAAIIDIDAHFREQVQP